jgi:hypothetical protein
MRKRYLLLGLALVLLSGATVGYVVQGARLFQRYHLAYANYHFIPTGPCNALIAWSPPSVLYTGFYDNLRHLLTLRYRSASPQTLRITISIPDLTQEESVEVQAAAAFQQKDFKPPLLAPPSGGSILDTLRSPDQRQGEIRLQVQSDSGDCNVTTPVVLKSRQWMHWYDPATDQNEVEYLAGWVTPDAPAISKLIYRASGWLTQHPEAYPGTSAFSGYLSNSEQDVRNQVNALFDTLQSVYSVRYAPDTISYDTNDEQRIQLPGDVLDSPAPIAMCVETTAILASAVEHLGMRPFIIIVPGHAFLGVALGEGANAPIAYWETSDLNGSDGAQGNVEGTNEYQTAASQGHVLQVVDIQLERQRGFEAME